VVHTECEHNVLAYVTDTDAEQRNYILMGMSQVYTLAKT